MTKLSERMGLVAGSLATVVLLGLGVPVAASTETETVDRTVSMKPGGTLTVKNFSGNVAITGADGAEVVVHAVRRAPRERLDRIKLAVDSDGTNVTVDANSRTGDQRDKENVVETDLQIRVPRQANLEITVFSSPVTVSGVSGSKHHVKTFSGALTLTGLTGPVDAESFSGAVTLAPGGWTAGQAVRVKTFSGDIEMRLPAQAGGLVEFDSFSGSLDTDVPMTFKSKTRRSVKAELGSASAGALTFKTFSGDLKIVK